MYSYAIKENNDYIDHGGEQNAGILEATKRNKIRTKVKCKCTAL